MNIVIIDGNTLNPGDLSWDQLSEFGLVKIYGESAPEDAISKLEHADIVLTNKFVINKQLMQRLPKLKCICVTATGYNIIDVQAATDCGITVCNASGYSTASTAQHTIALLLELTNNCADYDNSVRSGDWTNSGSWTYSRKPTIELAGLTLGIIGFGAIGQQVANIAQVLGMQVIAYKRNPPADGIDDLQFVSLEALYKSADVISMHCPLNAESQEMINEQSLSIMKPSAFLINTAFGNMNSKLL